MLKSRNGVIKNLKADFVNERDVDKYYFSRIIIDRRYLLAYESLFATCDEIGFSFAFAYVEGEKYDYLVGFSNFEPFALLDSRVILQEVSKKEKDYAKRVGEIFDNEIEMSTYILTSEMHEAIEFMKKKLFGPSYMEILVPLETILDNETRYLSFFNDEKNRRTRKTVRKSVPAKLD